MLEDKYNDYTFTYSMNYKDKGANGFVSPLIT